MFQGVTSHQQHSNQICRKFITKTMEKESQINHQEVLTYAMQGIKPRCFTHFRIWNTAKFHTWDRYNMILFGIRQFWLLGWWISSGSSGPPTVVSTQWFLNTNNTSFIYCKFWYAVHVWYLSSILVYPSHYLQMVCKRKWFFRLRQTHY